MNKTYEINDDELDLVNGGDFGDSNHDRSPAHSNYQVGQIVEVYFTGWHISTRRCKIIEATYNTDKQVWKYKCQKVDGSSWGLLSNCDDSTCILVTADSIER